MPQTTQRNFSWNNFIKLGFSLAFVVIIGYRFWSDDDLGNVWREFLTRWSLDRGWMIALVCALMPVNWLLETRKWTVLLSPSLTLTMRQGIKAIAGGIALSLFTPNRVGEYGGRILFVPSEYNWRAVVATLVGSLGQNTVHVTFGLVAAMCFGFGASENALNISPGYWIGASVFVILLLAGYFYSPDIARFALRIEPVKWLRRPWRGLQHLKKITTRELAFAINISLLRYAVFSFQFVLLLLYFDVGVPFGWLAGGVAVMYLMQTSIPLPPFVDLIARSELAIVLWAAYDVNELTVLAASFFIWIINLLIPAFFGLYAISTVNVLQSLGYEKKRTT